MGQILRALTDLFRRLAGSDRQGRAEETFRTLFNLYSQDGEREVEVLERRDRKIFLIERERVGGGDDEDRQGGRMVGPFPSAAKAESFITATDWFTGRKP